MFFMDNQPDNHYHKPFHLIGVSHHTLPVDERERLVLGLGDIGNLGSYAKSLSLNQAALLSTCNRYELLSVGVATPDVLLNYVERDLSPEIVKHLYVHRDRAAIAHFFRVAAGLDSMVVGESEIVGQIKLAYEKAKEANLVGAELHKLFQFALGVARRARSQTEIGDRVVSVSYLAIKLAEQVLGDLAMKQILVIGSGEVAELALLHLHHRGARNIVIANRTPEKAMELAFRYRVRGVGLAEMESEINSADLIFGSAQVSQALLTAESLRRRQSQRSLVLVDLGVPRNFSESVRDIDGVYLFNIDDLSAIAASHAELRRRAAKDAEIIVEYSVGRFEHWLCKFERSDERSDIKNRLKASCTAEVEQLLKSRLSLADYAEISETLAERISSKVLGIIESDNGSDDEEL